MQRLFVKSLFAFAIIVGLQNFLAVDGSRCRCSGVKRTCVASLPRTCVEWAHTNGVTSGNFTVTLDPDGCGEECGPVQVTCDLDSEPGKAFTILNHDTEAKTLVNGFEDCFSYKVNLTYTIGLECAKKIVDASSECKQFIRYDCVGAILVRVSGEPCTAWEDRNMVQSTYFTGNGSFSKYCDCAQFGNCAGLGSSGCTCNINDSVMRFDEGLVTNKDDLPITSFTAGDTGAASEQGSHTIGPVMCC